MADDNSNGILAISARLRAAYDEHGRVKGGLGEENPPSPDEFPSHPYSPSEVVPLPCKQNLPAAETAIAAILDEEPPKAEEAFKKAQAPIKDWQPTPNELLPRAMANYAWDTSYSFAQEEEAWQEMVGHLGVKRTFKEYFISIYSGAYPNKRITFAGVDRRRSPLRSDGVFKEGQRDFVLREAERHRYYKLKAVGPRSEMA